MENVLVVDDEANILKMISENLLIRGYKVSAAKTAADALEKLHARLPSLMVLDIKLPDLTGWELLDRIDRDPLIPNHFPVLIITASITDSNVDLTTYPNVVKILVKPFSTLSFVTAVEQSLSHPR